MRKAIDVLQPIRKPGLNFHETNCLGARRLDWHLVFWVKGVWITLIGRMMNPITLFLLIMDQGQYEVEHIQQFVYIHSNNLATFRTHCKLLFE